MNNKTFRKITYFTLVFTMVTPFTIFAQSGDQFQGANPEEKQILNSMGLLNGSTNTSGAPRAIIVNENGATSNTNYSQTQANAAMYGSAPSGNSIGVTDVGTDFASCVGSEAIASGIKNAIQGALSKVAPNLIEVPISDSQQRSKDSGVTIAGFIPLPSWDAAGWCLANAMLENIGNATVAWINSGFQDNPAFVTDPSQFFADLADQQAGLFLNELSNGFLCSPIQNIVRVNLANSYNSTISPYGNNAQCSFNGSMEQLEQFMSGESFSWADWMSYTQAPQNNPFGATLYGQIELDKRIASSLGVQSKLLDWGAGWLSHKDPTTGKIVSPGSMVQGVVDQRLNSGQRRLEIADEFDEITTALVNQLIKTAINEVTQQGTQ